MDISEWREGVREGVPIGIGYFAVSFGFGIAAHRAGLGTLASGVMSATNMTSAGQFAALGVISSGGSLLLMALGQLIINIRYALMSAALSQKIDPRTGFLARAAMAFYVTDEIFGLSAVRRGRLDPAYTLGLATDAAPGWVGGTVCGAAAGGMLSAGWLSALSVALYAMFVAVVVPQARSERGAACVVISAALLSALGELPSVALTFSPIVRTIVITVTVASAAAVLDPAAGDQHDE